MINYKMTVEYDGSRYKGWQRLGMGEITIQGEIERILGELVKEPIEIVGCSRTDGGVHAKGQVFSVVLSKIYELNLFQQELNLMLPEDIKILEIAIVGERFHPRYDARRKTYCYQIWNQDYPNPFLRKYSMYIKEQLDIDAMRRASQYFLGSHDFTAYSNVKTQRKSMIREIYDIRIGQSGGLITIAITGDGFLYNMVRKMVGTLIEIGLMKRDENEILKILNLKDRSQVGILADSQGLILEMIKYDSPE